MENRTDLLFGNRIYLLFCAVAALSFVFAVSAALLLRIRRRTGKSVRAEVWILFLALCVLPLFFGKTVLRLRLYTNRDGGMRAECLDSRQEILGDASFSAGTLKNAETFTILVLSLWFIAAAASVSYGVSSYWNTLQFLTKNSENCRDERVNRIFEETKKKARVRRGVSLRVMHRDLRLSPCTAGTWSPSVFIGADYLNEYSDLQLELIFLHELCHIRHNDGLLRLAALLVTSFHALIPLSGCVRRAINEDVEFLSDREVLRIAGQSCRAAYIGVILDIAERNLREDYQPDDLLSNASQAGEFLMARYRRMQTDSDRFRPVTLTAVLLAAALNASLFAAVCAENPYALRIDFGSPVLADAMCRYFDVSEPGDLTESDLDGIYRLEFYRPRDPETDRFGEVFYCIVNGEAEEQTPYGPAFPWENGAVDLGDLTLFHRLRTLIFEGHTEKNAPPVSPECSVIIRD